MAARIEKTIDGLCTLQSTWRYASKYCDKGGGLDFIGDGFISLQVLTFEDSNAMVSLLF